MSDLVLGLLVLGMLLFAGVLLYNRWQERAAQRAFGSSHPDALLAAETSAARHEPTLHKAEPPRVALPDRRVDYIMEVRLPHPGMLAGWSSVEQRFARRAMLVPGEDDATWHAALQLVSRAGVVNEAELIEFRSAVETLATKVKATVRAPEMRLALEAAQELDRACADADIQVALHVVGVSDPGQWDIDAPPFAVTRREDGVTLTLDVARTSDGGRSYEAMVRAGRHLATAGGGRLVDDNGAPLDERALAAIGAQLEAVRQELLGRGIEPGGPLALRLFS